MSFYPTRGKYKLDADGFTPVPVDNLLEWAEWFETADRRLALDIVLGENDLPIYVSTVFLAFDHNWFSDGPPLLWETLIQGGPHDGEIERYSTALEALDGHRQACERAPVAK